MPEAPQRRAWPDARAERATARARLAARAGRPGLGLRLAAGAGRRRGALAGGQAAQVVLRQQHRRRRRQLRAAAHLRRRAHLPPSTPVRSYALCVCCQARWQALQGRRAARRALASSGQHLKRVDVGF